MEPGAAGGVNTTLAATASWPSRKTVAVIGRCSPTTARVENDPHDTTGATSVMPRRRSARPVIAVTLSRSSPPSTSAPGTVHREEEPPAPADVRRGPRTGGTGRVSCGTAHYCRRGASTPPSHRPRRPARGVDAPRPVGGQPALVLAPGDP